MSQIHETEELIESQVPICGANLSTPVTDVTHYLDEIHYTIAGRTYIENAD
jgi:hypothetical protein